MGPLPMEQVPPPIGSRLVDVGVWEPPPPKTGSADPARLQGLVTPGTLCVMEAEARAGALGGREEAFIMMIRAEIG